MSLTRFTGNTNVISELADSPTLTAEQLKAKFDEADGSEKTFLNNTLIPEIEQLVASEKSTLQGLISALGTQLRAEIEADILADNQAKYHVGSIIMDTAYVNPATYLGFGEWHLWGRGRVPVCVNTNDTDFNTVEKTGGEKTHTLTVDEIPSHKHLQYVGANTGSWAIRRDYNEDGGCAAYPQGQTQATGGGQAHNNLQPYITCYMWKRTA